MPSKGKAPTPPSAKELATAQTGSNISTALANTQLGAVDQFTPQGSLKYTTSGFEEITDPSTGLKYKIPKRVATTTYSPEQQALYESGLRTSQSLAGTAEQQSRRLNDLLAKPFSLDNDATEGRIMELVNKRLQPQLDRRQSQLDNQLANEGVFKGSQAWSDAQRTNYEGANDAIVQALLQGRGQAVNEALTERNQPLNEIIGLASGTQVQAPQFQGQQAGGIPTTDYAALQQQEFANKNALYGQQQASWNDTLGGLFGLGSSLIKLSDRRAKKDVERIGETPGGLGVYSYRYKDGVMSGGGDGPVRSTPIPAQVQPTSTSAPQPRAYADQQPRPAPAPTPTPAPPIPPMVRPQVRHAVQRPAPTPRPMPDGRTGTGWQWPAARQPKQIGLMAQDVARKVPSAVIRAPGGMMLVDYARALKQRFA